MERNFSRARLRLKRAAAALFDARRPAAVALLLALLGCAPASNAQAERLEGQWLVEVRADKGRIQIMLTHAGRRAGFSQHGWNESPEAFASRVQGLTTEQMMSASGTNVRFQFRREAGAFDCEGWFRAGKGAGHFTFAPDRAFASELGRRGVGTPTDEQLFKLALADAGLALLDELSAQGYERPDVEMFIRLASHGVRLDYVRGIKAAGYQLGSLERLVRFRDHGVTPDFIRDLRDAGFRDLPADEVVRARDHGVSADVLRELKAEGYEGLSLAEVIRTRDHGVTGDFIRALRAEGYERLPLQQLVRLKDHGVSAAFIRELKAEGYANLSPEQLTKLRDHGVNAEFIRRVKADNGGATPPVEELIWLRNRGLTRRER